MARRNEGTRVRPSRGKLEWLVSVASALLVLAVLGYLIWEGIDPTAPPSFRTTVDSVRAAAGQYFVSFSVRNAGDHSVRDVLVRIELARAGSTTAASDIALDWLPAHSTVRAVAAFDRDPRGYEIRTSIQGYTVP